MKTLRQLTVESLTHLLLSGQEVLPVDDDARAVLRRWMLQAKRGDTFPSGADATGSSMTVEQKLELLRDRAERWKPARRLGTLRETMVFAVGNPHAELMLVGEAPGYDEERLREPFVGRAGQLLNKILTAMGLTREAVYISNVCKFRPDMGPNQGTSNRPPSPEEIAACLPLIMAEIRAVQPRCIICLGGSSAKALLGTNASVNSLRGRWLECGGIPLRVTYHPSYLLRNESLGARRSLWEDMLSAMELLGIPISARQRNYFLPT